MRVEDRGGGYITPPPHAPFASKRHREVRGICMASAAPRLAPTSVLNPHIPPTPVLNPQILMGARKQGLWVVLHGVDGRWANGCTKMYLSCILAF